MVIHGAEEPVGDRVREQRHAERDDAGAGPIERRAA
jgi:hypothetical protein